MKKIILLFTILFGLTCNAQWNQNQEFVGISDVKTKTYEYLITHEEITDSIVLGGGTYILAKWKSLRKSDFLLPYSNITSKPFIPSKTSDITNDSNFLTSEVDGSTTNEIQSLSISGNNLTISSGNIVGLPIPTNNNQLINGAGYITGYTETDPVWIAQKTAYLTIASANSAFQPIGTYLTGITSSMINTALGYTAYNGAVNPLGFLTSVPAQTWTSITGKPTFSTVATSGSYLDLSNRPSIPLADYTNTVAVTGGAGDAIFYLTSDKTSTGTALYTNINYVSPIVNNSAINYTYGWNYNATTKALTVNTKSAAGINVALVGLTLLGVPTNVANGTNIQILVKGN